MTLVQKTFLLITFLLSFTNIHSQVATNNTPDFTITVVNEQSQPMEGVTVELLQNEILIIDAAVTNVGTTVLEVLEKSPGVTVDRNGGIALQGKAGVLVLIDGKQTYLSGADLNNMLGSMSSSQVEQIELMTNPPARYD